MPKLRKMVLGLNMTLSKNDFKTMVLGNRLAFAEKFSPTSKAQVLLES